MYKRHWLWTFVLSATLGCGGVVEDDLSKGKIVDDDRSTAGTSTEGTSTQNTAADTQIASRDNEIEKRQGDSAKKTHVVKKPVSPSMVGPARPPTPSPASKPATNKPPQPIVKIDGANDATLAMATDNTGNGQNPYPNATGSGSWSYHASQARNLLFDPKKVTLLGWDAGTASSKVPPHYEEGSGSDDGRWKYPNIIPGGKVVFVCPGNNRAVIRWTSNVSDRILVDGSFAKVLRGGGDGVEVMVAVDGLAYFHRLIAFDDAEPHHFKFQCDVEPESVVDFVIGRNGPGPGFSFVKDGTLFNTRIDRVDVDVDPLARFITKVETLKEQTNEQNQLPNVMSKRWAPTDKDAMLAVSKKWQVDLCTDDKNKDHEPVTDEKVLAYLEELIRHTAAHPDKKMSNQELFDLGEKLYPAVTHPYAKFLIASNAHWIVEANAERTTKQLADVRQRLLSIDPEQLNGAPQLKLVAHRKRARMHQKSHPNNYELRRHDLFEMSAQIVRLAELKDLSSRERQIVLRWLEAYAKDPVLGGESDLVYAALESSENADPWIKKMLLGRRRIKLAWIFRGSGWANSVTNDGWRLFAVHLRQARRLFLEAWEVDPECSEPLVDLITVTMAQGGIARESPRFWFNQAVATDLDNMAAYSQVLYARMPRWGGSHAEILEIGRKCLASERYDTEVPWQFHKAILRIRVDDVPILEQPGILEEYEKLISNYIAYYDDPQLTQRHSLRLLAVRTLAGDKEGAKELLSKVPEDVDESPLREFGETLSSIREKLEVEPEAGDKAP